MSAMTRADACHAISELLLDLENHPDRWENPTLLRYLEALQAWLESACEDNEPMSWDLFVRALQAAKIYE